MEILPNDFLVKQVNDEVVLKNKMQGIKQSNKDKELIKTCKDFEAIFVNMMFKQMRNTISESGFIEKSAGTKIFEDMYFEEISKESTKGNEGLGLAKMIYNQFKSNNVKFD